MKKATPSDIKVETTIYAGDVRDQILERVSQAVTTAFESEISEAIAGSVDQLVRKLAGKEIEAAVKKVLTEGWARTDDYGSVRGTASLKDRIGEMLRAPDRYSGNGQWLDNLVKKETEAYLKGDLAKEIETAKAKMRAEVDQVTRAKLNEALRQALGVGA